MQVLLFSVIALAIFLAIVLAVIAVYYNNEYKILQERLRKSTDRCDVSRSLISEKIKTINDLEYSGNTKTDIIEEQEVRIEKLTEDISDLVTMNNLLYAAWDSILNHGVPPTVALAEFDSKVSEYNERKLHASDQN